MMSICRAAFQQGNSKEFDLPSYLETRNLEVIYQSGRYVRLRVYRLCRVGQFLEGMLSYI